MKNPRAFAILPVLLVLALIGGGTWLAKPQWFPGASKRAAHSTQATAAVEQAVNAQGASAAASVAKIGEANAAAPASPSRDFIAREIPVALARLPAPDPLALLEAEKRRAAVMEGRAEESRRLYEAAARTAAQLQRERDEALAQRRAADLALEQAAAAEHASTVQRMILLALALLAVAGWIYAKLYGVSLPNIGKMAADIRGGADPIAAIDTYIAPWHHGAINKAARLATPLPEPEKK